MDISHVNELNASSWNVMLQDAHRADQLAAEAEHLSRTQSYPRGLAESLLNRGWTAIYRSAYDEAIQFLTESESVFVEIKDFEGQAKTINAQGVVYSGQSDYNRALDTYRRGLVLAERNNLPERQVSVLNNIGEVYLELSRFDDAEEYFFRAIEILTGESPESVIETIESYGISEDMQEPFAVILGNIGATQLRKGNIERSEECLVRGLKLARDIDDKILEAEILSTFGALEMDRENAGAAEYYHTESLKISQASKNNQARINTLIHLGDVHNRLDQSDSALALYNQARETAEEVGSPYLISLACGRLADTLEKQRQYAAALKHHRRYASIRLQLLSESTEQKLKSLRDRVESERLAIANERLELINDFAREVTSTLDLDEIFNRIYERINELIDANVFAVALYDDEEGKIEFRLTIENGERMDPMVVSVDQEDSFAAYAVRKRNAVIVTDREVEEKKYVSRDSETLYGKRASSLVFLPLIIKERVVGVLTVQSFQKNAYSHLDISLIKTLSSFVSIAIDNALIVNRVTMLNQLVRREKDELQTAYKQISFLANHDHLTGLANRRMFTELLDLSIRRAEETESSLAIIFIDLDGFKPINDTFGHDLGDEVLKVVAERLKSVLRHEDVIARQGGDEFVGILQHAPSRDVLETIADKIHEHIVSPMEISGRSLTIGVSIGVAVYPENGRNGEELIKSADDAMYSGKQTNRNSVVFAGTA